MMAIAIGCECGEIFVAATLEETQKDFLLHSWRWAGNPRHIALSETNIPTRMTHQQFSVLRDVVQHQAGEYQMKQRVERRRNYERTLRAPVVMEIDDGLGAMRGLKNAILLMAGFTGIVVLGFLAWRAL